MSDYKTYLATNILSEDKVVTYRLLSRVLKVHVNTAKEMLYEFHKTQNAKKPGNIHATYLLSGTKRPQETEVIKKDGDDDYMQSSPFVGSSLPQFDDAAGQPSILSITLVKEENLEEAQSEYEHISSIHIYSLGPHPLKDIQLLSDVTRQIQELTAAEDPLELASSYGTITNKNVRRRTNRRPPPAAASLPTKATAQPPKPKSSQPKEAPKPAQASSAKDFFAKSKEKPKPATGPGSNPSSKESTPAPPATLKKESSNLFKSFAKAKPKIKEEQEEDGIDSPMKDVSDDDEETYVPPPQPSKEAVDSDRKARKEREEALRKMMEDDDDDDDDDEPVAEPIKDVEETKIKEASEEPVIKEEEPVVPGVKRRGRRRIMKKKTVKDAEGYLVTKEEPVWESFSEDEAPPSKSHAAATTTTKTKKAVPKGSQGSIMSFFGKK